jgi:glycosyltransferase involved in cell wall biosynthesis
VVGHAYIAPINREKWKVFATLHPTDEITVVMPDLWYDALFTLSAKDTNADSLSNCTFVALPAKSTNNEVRYRYKNRALYALLREKKPDIIYVEQGDSALSYLQTIVLSMFACPRAKRLFFTWINWRPILSLKHKVVWGFVAAINRFFSHGAVAGNHDAQALLQEKNFRKPILVLPQLGVTLDETSQRIEPSEKIIGFIGRLVPEKGIYNLLDAFAEAQSMQPGWRLVFVGNGPESAALKRKVMHKQLDFCVSVEPAMPHEEIFSFLEKVSIFVLPSYDTPLWREQFGHVLIEAMSLKIPVIGSTGGEIPYVIDDAGLVFTQRNAAKLAEKLMALMCDPQLRTELGACGYHRVHEHYTHQVIARKSREFLIKLKNKN